MLSVVISLNIQKLEGFKRIYQAECFPDEVDKMFGKRWIKRMYQSGSILITVFGSKLLTADNLTTME